MFLFLISTFCKKLNDDVKSIEKYTNFNMMLAIQTLIPKTDSKDFVDRPTKKPLKEVVENFKKLEDDLGIKPGKPGDTMVNNFDILENNDFTMIKRMTEFLEENFYPVGADITYYMPSDFNPEPNFIKSFKNEKMKKIGRRLNEIWKDLSRRKADLPKESVSTLFDLPYPFMVPGGRFREFYYWDTYFILEGLLVCDMHVSAVNIVKNFIFILETLGYIPNGTRKYYENRSQPPFFAQMLLKLLDVENGKYNDLILTKGLEMAEKELEFFKKYKSINVKGRDGNIHVLNYFDVPTNYPRLESFSEDVKSFKEQKMQTANEFYTNLKSGAESGWDFSSRWLSVETDISTIATTNQIPVDLNAILYRSEIIISGLYDRKKNDKKARYFMKKALKRKEAINQVLWNETEGSWMDYNYKTGKFVDQRFYFSNITPLVYGIEPPGSIGAYDILRKYKTELFGYKGGVPASGDGVETGQQWDFPNAWAPHQHMLVELLVNMKEDDMAFHVAKSFFNSVYAGFEANNTFFEKYNVLELGFTGGGGEYAPQDGFGWTNGVILAYMKYFGDKLMEPFDHKASFANISSVLNSKVSSESSYTKNMINSYIGYEAPTFEVN
ncbi:Trehalase [Dictyocoela muelleri]|nr:Trehalase [Dictyocoela muelleri]